MHKFLALLLCIPAACLSQTRLSVHEAGWALLHPAAAIKAHRIGKRLAPVYKDVAATRQLDAYSSGGQLDAFRHVFYMAAFAQKIKVKKIRKLGRAHEKANYRQFRKGLHEEGELPDSLSSVMDLRNNELGFGIGSRHKAASLEELKGFVIDAIRAGEALIMSRNKKGNYLDCARSELPPHKLRQWNTPKCLVSSEQAYRD